MQNSDFVLNVYNALQNHVILAIWQNCVIKFSIIVTNLCNNIGLNTIKWFIDQLSKYCF